MTDKQALAYLKRLQPRLTRWAVKDLLEQVDSENRLSYKTLCRNKKFIREWLENYMAYWEDDVTRHPDYRDAVDYFNKKAVERRKWWVEELKTQWHFETTMEKVRNYL